MRDPNLIPLGPLESGKGTHRRRLADALRIPWLPAATFCVAEEHVRRGDLVPDRLVVALMTDRLTRDDARHAPSSALAAPRLGPA